MSKDMRQEIGVYKATPELVRALIKEAGNQIGSVHFRKRKDNSLRKMSYRLHVRKPSVAPVPKGLQVSSPDDGVRNSVDTSDTDRNLSTFGLGAVKVGSSVVVQPVSGYRQDRQDRRDIDFANSQMTVLDVNKVVKDDGVVIGRGGWRTIPLENVEQITVNGKRYFIRSWK